VSNAYKVYRFLITCQQQSRVCDTTARISEALDEMPFLVLH
jgi:hypothetical protein